MPALANCRNSAHAGSVSVFSATLIAHMHVEIFSLLIKLLSSTCIYIALLSIFSGRIVHSLGFGHSPCVLVIAGWKIVGNLPQELAQALTVSVLHATPVLR